MIEDRETTKIENKEELKIAWRYENLSLEDSREITGNTYDLSIPYVIPENQKTNMTIVWYGDTIHKVKETKGKCFPSVQCIFLLTDFRFRDTPKFQLFKPLKLN